MFPVQQSYIQIVKLLENFASEHQMIQRFASDFEDQFNPLCTTGNTYPFMYVAPIEGTAGVAVSFYRFKVFIVDQLQKDRSNVNFVLQDSAFILGNLSVWLSEQNDSTPVMLLTEPTIIPLNNFGIDGLAGHYMEFEVEYDSPGLCDIPFENSPVVSGWTCDINYTNDYLTCGSLTSCTTFQNYISNAVTSSTGSTGSSANYYTTGATLIGNTAFFDRNDILSAYTLDLSSISGGTSASLWSASTGANSIIANNGT